MVSKILKKSPTKTIKDRRSRCKRRSPGKSAAASSSTIITSINKSFFTCQRRLAKIFSKLVKISTPKPMARKQGYQMLNKSRKDEGGDLAPLQLFFDHRKLPPLASPEKRTIFLDLDETLVHSMTGATPPAKYDFIVRPRIDGEIMTFYVLKRPGVDDLLKAIAENFEVVIFTAGLREYASLVLDRLDRTAAICHRLYRDSCTEMDGRFVKDLSVLGRDLRRTVIVDDNPNAYALQPANAIPIRPFIDDPADQELRKLIKFFDGSDCFDDMRDAVKEYRSEGAMTLKA